MTLPELEVHLREQFQTYRRRIDMLIRFKALGNVPSKETKAFCKALAAGDEKAARTVMKQVEVTRGD